MTTKTSLQIGLTSFLRSPHPLLFCFQLGYRVPAWTGSLWRSWVTGMENRKHSASCQCKGVPQGKSTWPVRQKLLIHPTGDLLRMGPYSYTKNKKIVAQQMYFSPWIPGAGSLCCGNRSTGVVRRERSRLGRMEVSSAWKVPCLPERGHDGATGY